MPYKLNAPFFAHIREALLGGRLSQTYVGGCNALAAKFDGTVDEFAYVLATAHHETAATLQPVIETRQANERSNPSVNTAIARLERAWKAGRMPSVKNPYWRKDENGVSWLGRGLPQTTHKPNYAKAERETGYPFTSKPDLMLTLEPAAAAMAVMMRKGLYTGKKLSDYFNAEKCDPVGARRIINGTDRAKLIAGHWAVFKEALELNADHDHEAARPVAVTTGKPMSQSTIVGASTGIGLLSALQLLGDALGQAKTHLQPIIDVLPASPTRIALAATVGLAVFIAYRRYKHSKEDGF